MEHPLQRKDGACLQEQIRWATAAQRMREVWFYLIHLFDDAEKLNKQLRRFRTPSEYERIQTEVLASCPIRSDVQGDLI